MFFFFIILGAAAKKAWKVLRQQFKVHFDKLPVLRSGGEPEEDLVDWPYFRSLMFLKDVFEKRSTTDNLDDVELDTEDVVDNRDEEEEEHTQNNDYDISPPLTPSSQTSSVGRSFASTGHTCSSKKADNLGYRKRSNQMDIIGKNLVEIEKEKIQMKKAKETSNIDRNDEDIAFFTSLLPHVKKLAPAEKLRFRMKVQTILMESVYKIRTDITNSTSFDIQASSPLLHERETVNRLYTNLQPGGFDYDYNI